MQTYFYELVDFVNAGLTGREVALCNFFGEESDFVRYNRSTIRQAGSVEQRGFDLTLIRGQRHAAASLAVSGDPTLDRTRLSGTLERLRGQLDVVPDDPFLCYSTDVRSTEAIHPNRLPEDRSMVVNSIVEAGAGRDLVGILAMGGIHRGFANSLGQRNWFSIHTHHFDWSFYSSGDKAVKSSYAGAVWDPAAFRTRVDQAARELEILRRPPKTIAPGRYRVYLAPSALAEVMQLLSWGGFGLTARRTRQTPLLRMVADGARLDPSVTVTEEVIEGTSANFEAAGFVKPDRVSLIKEGALAEALVSPRASKEFGVETNAAGGGEAPQSLVMAAGDLSMRDVLERLGTGIFVNNLWYLGYSDRGACRMTGMTRFATFWVENGAIEAPLNVMRFDETLYRMLGENLIALTRERELLMDPNTYHSRSTSSMRLPGALIEDFTLTL